MNVFRILAADCSGANCIEQGIKKVNGSDPQAASVDDVTKKVRDILLWAFVFIGLLAVIMIIYGGFLMMTSAGDPGKTKKGRDTVIWGVIGLIVTLLAGTIVNFIISVVK